MLIRLHNACKTYQIGVESVRALAGVDLDIDRGEFVAIMGPSGSGKSTLMNLIGCLDRCTSGDYELDGRNTTRLSAAAMAHVRNKQIGFVFQSFELLPKLSAARNVELPLIYSPQIAWWDRKKLARQALARVGLAHRLKHKPNQMSGGEKQRVAIARAIVAKPNIILADEPTGNLDSKTSYDIMAIFAQLNQDGQTVVLVTHESDIAGHAKRIIHMKDGRIDSDHINSQGGPP
jgi:putative ABC transport system ATP-binding protein